MRRAWPELALRLNLAGAEERSLPGLRAWRDPERPAFWDRHLALAAGRPGPGAAQSVAELDGWYGAGEAEQWSLLVPPGPAGAAWRSALRGDCYAETVLFMERRAGGSGRATGTTRLEGEARFARWLELRLALATRPSEERAARTAVDLLARRERAGLAPALLVAPERGRPVAGIVLTVLDELAWLEDLETHPEHRRRGHGRALLAAALEHARAAGARWVGLDALEPDWTWRWYEREGFAVASRWRRLRRRLS